MAGLRTLLKRGLLSKPRSFMRGESGTTAIEFALLGLPFFAIVGAILETAMVFLAGQMLDSAVQDASRQIRTGQAQSASINLAQYRTRICDRTFGLFGDCSALHIEVQKLDYFNDATIGAPIDPNCKSNCGWTRPEVYSPGAGSGIVMVQVYYKWPVMLNFAFSFANLADGKRLMGAATVFRNEPFT